jgi:hypothetical protein
MSHIYVMCCEKKVIELKQHAVLVYENVLFAEGRSLVFRSPLSKFSGVVHGDRMLICM